MNKPRLVPDASARDRIVAELDRNLLVEAGAGSGKTQKLAERMAAGVACGKYELGQMAAITFTRKAAAELRGRFQLALEAALASSARVSGSTSESADMEPRAARLRAALSNLERFFAGTIHSFCARLLRERPVESGVSPGFTELDDVEERLVREQSWRDYRAQAKASGDPDLLELIEAGISARQLDKAFETICLYEDVTFPGGDAPMPDTALAWEALAQFWASQQLLMPAQIPQGSTCKTLERAERFARQWRAYGRGRRDLALLVDLLRTWDVKPDVVLKWWDDEQRARQAKQLHGDFRAATVIPFLTAWRQHLYRRCVALLMKARNAAKADRRRRNELSFNDLLIMTADVLRTNADVRHALQEKYRWLFVDEFQDTDPVQAEIMFLLAADPHRESGSDPNWRTTVLRPGALFVVGDPKQSIYRFRRADIDIYNEVRARLGGSDGKGIVHLTTNFRSVPGLCAWANDVFRTRFPAAPSPQAPMFARLDPYRPQSSGAPDIAVVDLPAGIPTSDVAVEEAARIARYIRSEVDAGRRRFGDFLVLTRKKKGLGPYVDALESLQVPIEVSGAGAFGESAEVRELALLLNALADPQDAVTLVGVLRGPLFGLSDPDLFAFRQAGGYFSIFAELTGPGAPMPAAQPVARALESLRQWFKWTRMLPAGAALEHILEDSGYLALAATSRGGVEAGDLLHAVDRVRAVVEEGFTLADAAEALASWSRLDDDEASEESAEVDSLPLEPGRRDVVRLMNLHKAKGLEAEVVFLADPLGGFEPRVDVRIVRDVDGGAVGYFKIVEDKKGYAPKVLAEPSGWAAHEAAEQSYLTAEVDRLLYVAATRARDTLVVGRYGKTGNSKRAWAALTDRMPKAVELKIPSVVAPPVAEAVDLSARAAANAKAATISAHEQSRTASWSTTSVTAETKRLPRVSVEPSEALESADPTRPIVPDTPSHRSDAGMAWGVLVHGLLEHAMRHKSATRDDLRRLAMWLTVEEPRLRGVIEQALDTVETVSRAEFWKQARTAAESHEEVPFAVREESADVPRVVTGAIDLVHRAGDGWQLIDYKTDVDLGDPEIQRRYEQQVQKYAAAWKRLTRGSVATTIVQAR